MSELVKEASFDKEALQKKATEYFAKNKDAKVVFLTADGFMFLKRNFASDHANTLEGKEVFDFKNPNHVESNTDQTEDGNTQLTEEQKQLLVSGLEVKNYNAIKALVKVLNIETPDQKAETLIKALEDYKANNPID